MQEYRISVQNKLIDWAFYWSEISTKEKQAIRHGYTWLNPKDVWYLRPTVKQLETLSVELHVSFGDLLLDEIPNNDIDLEFHNPENVPSNVSQTVCNVIHEMQSRQAWYKEESNCANQRLISIGRLKNKSLQESFLILQKLLHVKATNTFEEQVIQLENQISDLGILVMNKSGVNQVAHEDLSDDSFRAFSLLDDYAPLVFVNFKANQEEYPVYLIHELIHILRASDELLISKCQQSSEELLINQLTTKFLRSLKLQPISANHNDFPKVVNGFLNLPMIVNRPISMKNIKSSRTNQTNSRIKDRLKGIDSHYLKAVFDEFHRETVLPTKLATLLGLELGELSLVMDTCISEVK
ncbi:hypothetical protein [Fructobacillus ficulneus]|uniref:DNA-binding protein n=1 Tax=Fructobacillus ficulneus TaxID=157463 RepID=A0A0K8MIC8_9LACO|nr:hypothetical protein [Fructobacillus ficulneus]GAO99619.1 DNA-binding protein [Fructobacillus ficulneus]